MVLFNPILVGLIFDVLLWRGEGACHLKLALIEVGNPKKIMGYYLYSKCQKMPSTWLKMPSKSKLFFI